MKKAATLALPFFLSLSPTLFSQNDGWKPLFNGQDLNGWEVRGGTAEYRVEDGQIVGTTRLGTPNTFLCTEEMYADFVLELEVRVDTSINSGIQFRSNTDPAYYNGIVHGYQAEVDPSARAWSGGIYDEGRRGWLYPLEDCEVSRLAFVNGSWNHYRIEAIGSHIRIWVNGVNTANLADSVTASGFIGLQVHSVDKMVLAGREVRWRNIRVRPASPGFESWPLHPCVLEKKLTSR